jgi:hypothetical protein
LVTTTNGDETRPEPDDALAMADWRTALQQQLYPVLTRLLQEGFVLPLYVTCIGRNGSMMCGRYDDNEDSPQQATGYQKENRLLMRNHGFSNSSL